MLPAHKSPGAPFSSSVFISTSGTLSEDEESMAVACDSQGVEATELQVLLLLLHG